MHTGKIGSSAKPDSHVSQGSAPYVPTGLRMKTETLDAVAQDITLDGGPVAKTTDKLSDKVIAKHFI